MIWVDPLNHGERITVPAPQNNHIYFKKKDNNHLRNVHIVSDYLWPIKNKIPIKFWVSEENKVDGLTYLCF